MNEQAFHLWVKQRLDRAASDLDRDTAARLHEARRRALSRQKVAVHGFSLAGIGNMLTGHFQSARRTLLSTLAVAALAVGAAYFGQLEYEAEIEEVDSALLADDLPIDAYLDRGFDAWVHTESESAQ